MTKLAETYIHLKIDATREFTGEAREYFYEIAKPISYDLFHQDIEIEIRFEDGSWKTWIAVSGAIYIGIGQYGSFRSGIDYLVKDERKFSDTIIERFVDEKKIDQDIIFRTERRLGVPGKIQRLFKRIDRLDEKITLTQEVGSIKQKLVINFVEDRDKEIEKIKKEIISIIKKLTDNNDRQQFFDSLPSPLKKDFPEGFPMTKIDHHPMEAITNEDKKLLIAKKSKKPGKKK